MNKRKPVTVGQIADNFDFFTNLRVVYEGENHEEIELWSGDIYMVPPWYADLIIATDTNGEGCYIHHETNEHDVLHYTIVAYVVLPEDCDYSPERVKELAKAEKKFYKWIDYREGNYDGTATSILKLQEKKDKFYKYCRKHNIDADRMVEELS